MLIIMLDIFQVFHHEHLVSSPVNVMEAVNQFLGLWVSHHHLAATLALLDLDAPEQERLQLLNVGVPCIMSALCVLHKRNYCINICNVLD